MDKKAVIGTFSVASYVPGSATLIPLLLSGTPPAPSTALLGCAKKRAALQRKQPFPKIPQVKILAKLYFSFHFLKIKEVLIPANAKLLLITYSASILRPSPRMQSKSPHSGSMLFKFRVGWNQPTIEEPLKMNAPAFI